VRLLRQLLCFASQLPRNDNKKYFMLIGIDASRANRKYKSGTEWYSYYLIRELARIDAKNQYLLYTDKPLLGGLADLISADKEIRQTKIKVDKKGWQEIKSPHNNFRAKIIKCLLPLFWTQLRLSQEMLFSPPDVLFIPAHTLPFIHPRKSVVTIHDIGFMRKDRLYSHEQIGPTGPIPCWLTDKSVRLLTKGKYGANVFDYHDWSTKFALRHAKKVITISKFSQKEILDIYQADKKKIEVVYHGYNSDLYKKIDNKAKIKQVLDKYGINSPYIFYVGRLEKKKNIPNLVEAYAIMREKYKPIKHKLVLVGSASHGFDEVNYIIQEFRLNDEVIITGWLPEDDMPYIYNGAAALIFPSFYEGFGLPLLQAMACGTPIAAAKTAAIPEIVQDCALLFDPAETGDMADSLAKIITDNNLRSELIKRGYSRIASFSWRKCARETLNVLEKL